MMYDIEQLQLQQAWKSLSQIFMVQTEKARLFIQFLVDKTVELKRAFQ